jgi:hypothetical protein
MMNYAMPAAIAFLGLGLMSIGFNLNGNTATATPASFNAGPEEPTIVWYDVMPINDQYPGGLAQPGGTLTNVTKWHIVYRAWSDGTVERRAIDTNGNGSCETIIGDSCASDWHVVVSPNEGLNAAADINFDSRVNAEDLGIMLAAWGDAPRNVYPPSDCPLGLIP